MAESACLDGIPAGLWRWPFLWGSEPSSFCPPPPPFCLLINYPSTPLIFG